MKKLSVAMLSYHTCPIATLGGKDTGGMNVYVREITRELGNEGVHVDVFTRSQDEHVPHVLHDLGFGNRVVHVPAGPELPRPKQELVNYLPQYVEGILEFARTKGIHYDLIHSHYWMSGIAAIDLKAELNVPFVHMFHTLGMMKNRVAQAPDEREGEYRVAGEQKVLASADRIVAATQAELSQLQFLYKANSRKIVIIPPGVDTHRFYPIPQDEAREFIGVGAKSKILLFVGRIEPLKGLDILLQSIALLRDRGVLDRSPFCLLVIGGDPDESTETMSAEMLRLQELRKVYGLQSLVALLGKRSQDTLPYYYSSAEAVVVPSHYESFGMVALEAMACGAPVVASEVGGLAYLVKDGETGYTVPVGDPLILADRLAELLMNEAKRNQLSQQASELASQYAWPNIVKRLLKVYHEVLNKQHRPEKSSGAM